MFNTVAGCRLQLFNPWSGWLKISKDPGIWGWSAASCIVLRKKSHSETERNSNPVGASPQKQIPHAVGFSAPPRAHKAIFSCVDTCTGQLPRWLESQEAQNLPTSLQALLMEGTRAFLVVFTFWSAGYVHRIDSVGEVF